MTRYSLTPIEAQVLTLLALGATREETSRMLDRSLNTIKTHLRRTSQRFGALSTTHLVALAIAHGVLLHDTSSPTEGDPAALPAMLSPAQTALAPDAVR